MSASVNADKKRCPRCGSRVALVGGELAEHGSVATGPCSGEPRPFGQHRNEVERQIIVTLVEDLLANGYSVGVNDGEERVLEPCKDMARIFGVMSTTDEDYLLTERESDERTGWIRLIYGNDGDVISDYTTNIPDEIFERANALSDRFSGDGS